MSITSIRIPASIAVPATVCPVEAIYQEDMVPEEEQEYIEINANFFK